MGELTTIKDLLRQQIQKAVDEQCEVFGAGRETPQVQGREVFLDKLETRLIYRSAIALRLAPAWNIDPLNLARRLALHWSQAQTTLSGVEFQVDVIPPAGLEFQLNNFSVANWMQKLTSLSPIFYGDRQTGRSETRFTDAQVFLAQYAHARCCSLLRLGTQEKLISLSPVPPKSSCFNVIQTPQPLPWLTEQGHWQFRNITERNLMLQIVASVDLLMSSSTSDRVVKAVQALSQDFLTFEKTCRIWGEVKRDTPELALSRLGLVAATQRVLEVGLREGLQRVAPVEL